MKRGCCSAGLLILLANLQFNYCFADYKDSLAYLLHKTKNPEHRLELLIQISEKKRMEGDHRCLEYSEEAVSLADSLNNQEKIAESKYTSGLAWRLCSDNSTAIIRLFNAADIYNKLQIKSKYACTLREIGETYRANGNHSSSLEYLREALRLHQELKDWVELAKTYNRMAATNYEVIFFNETYLEITKSEKPSATAIQNLIATNKEMKSNLDSTLQFLDTSDYYARKFSLEEVALSNQIVRGALYSAILDFKKADSTLSLALQLARSLKNEMEEALVYYNFGRLKMNQGKYSDAIECLLKSYNLAKKTNTRVYTLISSHLLGELYQRVNKPHEAIRFMNISQSEIAYFYKNDLGLREKALQYQNQLYRHKSELQLQSAKTGYLTRFFLYTLTLFALFVTIIYIKNKKLKKLNLQLEQKNSTIASQNTNLIALNTEKDKFFSIIAHDLRGPLGTFVSIMDIMTEEIRKKRFDKVQLLADNLQIVSYHLYSLLENLLDWSKIQRNLIAYTPRKINLKRFIEDSTLTIIDGALNKGIKVEYYISEDLEITTDPHMLQAIIRNLTANAIKFTHEGGLVKILANKNNGTTEIIVADTGVGMDKEMASQLFMLNKNTGRPGTNHEPSSGLGLILCKDFIEKMGGTISVESEVNQGSIFRIVIPQ